MSFFGIRHYESFVAAIVVFQIVPGPGTFAILNSTARGGVSAGMRTVFGTLAGDFVFMLAAMLGLAAVLATYPGVFAALQWFGILYLMGFGVGLLRARVESAGAVATPVPGSWRQAGHGFAVSLTNPKAIAFFMAFFPLFMSEGASKATLIAMMLHVTGISLAYQSALVFAGNAIARRLGRFPRARALATRLGGIALIGFGMRLAVSRK
jgi:threonine/homoserine/homoserine lactone efflux protein